MADSNKKTTAVKNKVKTETISSSGLGSLLREERRNRSLDRRQVAQLTRLREHFIEALEREDWEQLPPPVFVRGFIQSYARALGLDVDRVLDLYEQSGTPEPSAPKPLLKPESSGRGRRILILLLVGILAGALVYLWQGGPAPEWPTWNEPAEETVEPAPPATPSPAKNRYRPPPPPPPEEQIEPPSTQPPPADSSPAAPARKPLPAGIDPYPDPPRERGVSEEGHTLEIEVTERTWVQISVDGEEPKDFIFRKGSHPRWKGGETYNLHIGNAAGITVHFDGETLRNLGKPGEVIRLKLPQDLE